MKKYNKCKYTKQCKNCPAKNIYEKMKKNSREWNKTLIGKKKHKQYRKKWCEDNKEHLKEYNKKYRKRKKKEKK